jgi:hypothetical protein
MLVIIQFQNPEGQDRENYNFTTFSIWVWNLALVVLFTYLWFI